MKPHRFLQPAVPSLILLAAWAGRYLGGIAPSFTGRTVLTTFLALVFLSQPLRIFSHDLRHPNTPLDRPLGLVEPWSENSIGNWYKLGQKLRDVMPADATIALTPAGAIPFTCERTTFDMLGLNDREIAHLSAPSMGSGRMGHEKGNGQVILARKPDFILLRGRPNPEVGKTAPPDTELELLVPVFQIWKDENFHAKYEPFLVIIDEKTSFTVYRKIATG